MTDEVLAQVREALSAVNDELPAAERRINRKLRRYLSAVLVVMLLAVAAIGATGYVYVRGNDRAACEAGNQVRAGLLAFVDTILMPAQVPPNPTPQQLAAADRRAAFIAEAHKDFVLRDCG